MRLAKSQMMVSSLYCCMFNLMFFPMFLLLLDIFDFDEDMLDSTTQRNSIETATSPFPLSSDDDDYDSSSNDG